MSFIRRGRSARGPVMVGPGIAGARDRVRDETVTCSPHEFTPARPASTLWMVVRCRGRGRR